MAIEWPEGVPSAPWEPGYTLEPADELLRSSLDIPGLTKQRALRAGAPRRGTMMLVMTPAEFGLFEAWFETTAGYGAERVNWTEPLSARDGELSFVGGGRPYTAKPWRRLYVQVSIPFEFYPDPPEE
jgi:hypothetical protein